MPCSIRTEALGVQFPDALPDGVMFRELSRTPRFRRVCGACSNPI
jgi:hypothetical protein